jgi:hypothetical protein
MQRTVAHRSMGPASAGGRTMQHERQALSKHMPVSGQHSKPAMQRTVAHKSVPGASGSGPASGGGGGSMQHDRQAGS